MRLIVGIYKNKLVQIPANSKLRPTLSRIRQNLWNILGNDLENKSFCDLFAGSGVIGIEALSINACRVWSVECDKNHFLLLKNNFKNIVKTKNYEIYNWNFRRFLDFAFSKQLQFDFIYIDPPYSFDYLEILEIIKNSRIDLSKTILILESNKQVANENLIFNLKTYRYGNKFLQLVKIK